MKACHPARDDAAGAETVGALILFGIFVATLAYLNVTAVPQAGLENEERHFTETLASLNALQASAEAATLPGGVGTSVSQAISLGPTITSGSDFFGHLIATPAQAAGELTYNASYGNIRVYHTVDGSAALIYDAGSAASGVPLGQIAFDPHPNFRRDGIVSLENGALITTDGESETLRYAPPVSVSQSAGISQVTIKTRILNGTSGVIGGTGAARISLATEATTLTAPTAPNADSVTMRVETRHGNAWGDYLNTTSAAAGMVSGVGYVTLVENGAAPGGLDVVTWTFRGIGAGNDVRLTTGLSIMRVVLS